ncbi:rhodanese-like domain-containing protein [Arsenicibacter rosenii]|uniref:Rhodanese n=1 Tax=Arsenicibacter rosenii TaxID=1750698 RepID=A0A1S2VH65_9BACT|nr:rhodanese-like domain-containing protein [Arsenicibacter rosenii]OIN57760.1 rhodanese [Arsenicibacter rosenii]
MKIRQLLPCLLCICTLTVKAQVTSKAYKALLETLYSKTVPLVSCEELKKMPDPVLLDTRESREYAVSHLPDARWVGYDDFDISRVKDIPKTAVIVTYCSVGYRSEKVGDKLLAAGYKHVYNLYGSIFEWVNQGNTVVDQHGKPTRRVHAYSRAWGIWLRKGEKVYD